MNVIEASGAIVPEPDWHILFNDELEIAAAAEQWRRIAGYFGKKLFGGGAAPQSSSAVLTGVGLEFGSREQTERLISAVNRVADVLEAKKLASLEAEVRRFAGEVDEMGEEQRWERPP